MRFIKILGIFLCMCAGLSGLFSADDGVISEEVADGFSFLSTAIGSDKRWKVDGDSARFLLDGSIEITGVKAEVFGRAEETYYVYTDRALVNRNFNEIKSDTVVRIIRGETEISGEGLEWNADKKVAIIKKNVKVIIIRGAGEDFLQ